MQVTLLLALPQALAQTATVAVSPGIINPFAGTGKTGSTGDGGPATAALLNFPCAIRSDAAGNLYILDTGNMKVREVTTDGNIKTVVGNGVACSPATAACGDGGQAINAQISSSARGLFVTANGTIYIGDTGINRVRMVTPQGIITTIAGTGASSGLGNGGPATAATLNSPHGIYVDGSGVIYIADSSNNEIRTIKNGTISLYAGGASAFCSGTTDTVGDGCAPLSAKLLTPEQVWEDAAGNVYITDTANARVRKVDLTNTITTVAGNGTAGYGGDGGAATSAELNLLQDAIVDAAGDLLIADYSNQRVRYVDGKGVISTFTGTGTAGFTGNGGYANVAAVNAPHGVAFDPSGNVYVVDYGDSRVRVINTLTTQLSYPTTVVLQSSATQTATLTATGAAALTITSVTVPTGYAQVASGGVDCAAALTIQPRGTCQLAVQFVPTLNGPQNGMLLVATNAANEAQGLVSISLTGTGVYNATVPTASTLFVTPTTIYSGQSVTMTATVGSSTGSGPTGTVSFYSGKTLLQTIGLNAGIAVLTTTALPVGTDAVTVMYNGDPTYKPSTSAATTVTVYAGPPDFSVTPASTAVTVSAGKSAVVNVAVASLYGYVGSPALSCTGLAANMSCLFLPSTVTLAANASYTVLLAIGTTSAPPSLTGSLRAGTVVALGMLAPVMLCLFRGRRRRVSVLLVVILGIASVALDGCSTPGTAGNTNVAGGTYNITVQGVAAGVTHSATIAVTVQ